MVWYEEGNTDTPSSGLTHINKMVFAAKAPAMASLPPVDRVDRVNGAPISVEANDSTRPDITFSGNTPYVSWREDIGAGVSRAFLGHFVNATNPTSSSTRVTSH